MTALLRASDVSGLPVVSISDGEDIAEIRDVIYDGGSHQLLGFTLNKRGFFHGKLKERLDATGITSIGPDAVMVADDAELADRSDVAVPLAQPDAGRSVVGVTVLTEAGVQLGTIADVILLADGSPRAVGYQLTGPDLEGRSGDEVFIPISAQMAISGEALVLPADATDFVRNDLAGFGAAVADYATHNKGLTQ